MEEFIEKRFSELEVGDVFFLCPDDSTPLSEKIGQGYCVGVKYLQGFWPPNDFTVYVLPNSKKGTLHTFMPKPALDVLPHPFNSKPGSFLNIDLSGSK